ncbi:hypothetical protein RF11_00754 [Thelohanellus kitauei]|uniref:Uncharacterized protein n=1 Tax=Thelohanellus kitauei TaxID=669202 RepID=A0A0C2IZA4_THEKT|nr:hypothetical protein RF11_00754 [Thelohanellus kitauei]
MTAIENIENNLKNMEYKSENFRRQYNEIMSLLKDKQEELEDIHRKIKLNNGNNPGWIKMYLHEIGHVTRAIYNLRCKKQKNVQQYSGLSLKIRDLRIRLDKMNKEMTNLKYKMKILGIDIPRQTSRKNMKTNKNDKPGRNFTQKKKVIF